MANRVSGLMLCNHTNSASLLHKSYSQCETLLKKKAYLDQFIKVTAAHFIYLFIYFYFFDQVPVFCRNGWLCRSTAISYSCLLSKCYGCQLARLVTARFLRVIGVVVEHSTKRSSVRLSPQPPAKTC